MTGYRASRFRPSTEACAPLTSPTALAVAIQPADVLAAELITRADRKRIQRSAGAAMASILLANHGLTRMSQILRFSRLDPQTRSVIAEELRMVACAQQAATLHAAEVERIARRMGVA